MVLAALFSKIIFSLRTTNLSLEIYRDYCTNSSRYLNLVLTDLSTYGSRPPDFTMLRHDRSLAINL